MRYILSIIGVIVFIVAVIVIISLGSAKPKPVAGINLDNYNTSNSSLSQVSTGSLVGEGQRQAVEIIITQNERTLEYLTGYEQTVTQSETYPNTPAAYSAFLQSMVVAGFVNSRKTTETNILGICPQGDTYFYQFTNNNKQVTNLWSTSCDDSDGNFAGDGPIIKQLFQAQIPNFQSFINKNNISLAYEY